MNDYDLVGTVKAGTYMSSYEFTNSVLHCRTVL